MTLQLKNLFNLRERKADSLRLLYEADAPQIGIGINAVVRV